MKTHIPHLSNWMLTGPPKYIILLFVQCCVVREKKKNVIH